MAIINETIAAIRELIPPLTLQHKLKNLVELQTASCVAGDDKTYLDEAIAAHLFQQCTGISANAKTRKVLYDYQQRTGITWPELALCYRRLLTVDGKIRAPNHDDRRRPLIFGFVIIVILSLIIISLWLARAYVNPIIQIVLLVFQFVLGYFILKFFELVIDIRSALKQISKLHNIPPQP